MCVRQNRLRSISYIDLLLFMFAMSKKPLSWEEFTVVPGKVGGINEICGRNRAVRIVMLRHFTMLLMLSEITPKDEIHKLR